MDVTKLYFSSSNTSWFWDTYTYVSLIYIYKYIYIYIYIYIKNNWIVKHDEINIIFDHCLLTIFLANWLVLCDFRQIILYLGLSTWTHIEYRIKSISGTYSFFCFFGFIIYNVPFYIKKQLFIGQFLIIRKMFTFDKYFWLEITNTYTTKQWNICLFCTFCVSFLCNDILLMQKNLQT